MAHSNSDKKIVIASDADARAAAARQAAARQSHGPTAVTRRDFFRTAACAALGTTGLLSTVWDMRRIAAAAPVSAAGDHKALVCIFLYGGNDSNNTLIPRSGSDYNAYASARQGLALPASQLHAVTPSNFSAYPVGLHPSLPDVADLFNAGKIALQANVGTLVEPMTLADYKGGFKTKPLQLFSHSDQQFQWQASISTGGNRTGWGGRSAEILDALNGNNSVSMSISLNGTNTFQVADNVSIFQVGENGPVDLWNYQPANSNGYQNNRSKAVEAILQAPYDNLFRKQYAQIFDGALGNNATVGAALDAVDDTTPGFLGFQNNPLGRQLKMIAQLIAARNEPGMPDKRQVFFAGIGGFDTHGQQLTPHANLLAELNAGLKAFHDVLVELGVWNNVTTFTASDFGRNYIQNGDDGSDHGWGSHQMVMGGNVDGGKIFGQMPTLAVNGPDDVGLGRWLPTTSVDEFGATLARWFGVSTADLPQVFPNLYRFPSGNATDLGFML